ncbi:hypothetical protein BRETT_005209 [Brettanomyces bruxellensis]|uniref:Major facilitator superfamily (MFS) profile domain-containing protein n=1 Tax=Dekkera bruxellensis TaxID=5007 RepID=A0A871QZ85_DEKBR|nr:uncharacterized protein BRETT_005209 [Brettanomyces bruxellensis]QOU18149.1 hypothetical protein BRETT_005209 [Brettanomyces bruxellensis]
MVLSKFTKKETAVEETHEKTSKDEKVRASSESYAQNRATGVSMHLDEEAGPNSSSIELTEDPDDPKNYPDGGWRAYLVVFGAFLGLTVDFGFINSVGAVQSYLNLHQLADVPTGKSSYIFSVFMLMTYVFCALGGVAFDELGPKIPTAVGAIITFFGMFFTGSCNNVGSFVGVFGICVGFGLAVISAPMTGVISHWFYRNRSKAFALATLGGSVGGIVFPLILNRLYIVVGFTWAMRILAFICLVMNACSCLLVSGRRSHVASNGEKSRALALKSKSNRSRAVFHEIKTLCCNMVDFKALKEIPFLFCTIGIGFSDLALVGISTYYPSFITYIGYSETKANSTITITNAMGIIGRYLPGILADRIGPFNVMIMMMTGATLSVLLFWLCWGVTSQSMASAYVFSVIYGFFDSSVLSLVPSCIGSVSPTSKFGQRYGTSYLCAGLVIFGGVIGGGAIIGEESLEHYKYFSAFAGSLYGASTICYIICRFKLVGWKLRAKV